MCGRRVKWEASRIRDHLKFHREAKDKLSIKEYGEKFRDYIVEELAKVKGVANIPTPVEEETGVDPNEAKRGYSAEEWKALHSKKLTPRDRVTCE